MIAHTPQPIWNVPGKSYRLIVWISPDYTVCAANLPGCVSQGETIKECLRNIEEAFLGLAESYKSDDKRIPFIYQGERPRFHEEFHLTVSLEEDPIIGVPTV